MLKRTIILMVALILLGCGNPDIINGISDEKILEGKIVKKTGTGLFLELIGESQKISDKISAEVEDDMMLADVEEGQRIKVWYDHIRESYPPQTRGLKVEVLE
ncbi:MAG: DUF3221 domain-containing protein [Bacillota bacterium]